MGRHAVHLRSGQILILAFLVTLALPSDAGVFDDRREGFLLGFQAGAGALLAGAPAAPRGSGRT